MVLANPKFLWVLIGVAAVAALALASTRRRRLRLRAFADDALVGRLTPDVDVRRRALRWGLRLAALAALVLSLVGPKWGFHWEEVHREGIDLIVAIDTSRSMLATDVKPNRLERAKLAVLDMVKLLEGDRIGLVAFAGSAFLECPLTLDYAAFERSLLALQVGIIPHGGTALGAAIDVGIDAFEARQGKYEALILITDGEDHVGNVDEAAQRAAERSVKVYSVGIGTPEGELIPVTEDGTRGFVKDRQGQVVKSRLDEEVLRKVALDSGGAYVRGLGVALGLDQVFQDHIAKMERREVASTLERRYEERFQIPLALALVCLVLETLLGERKRWGEGVQLSWFRRWRRRRTGDAGGVNRGVAGSAPPSVSITLLVLFLTPMLLGWLDPPADRAAEGNRLYDAGKYEDAVGKYGEGLVDDPESPLLQFNLAAALYKQGKYSEALGTWGKLVAGGDSRWLAAAAYNLGNAHYRLGSNAEESDPQAAISSYEQALLSYKRALAADSEDVDAKFNHELVARKLDELKERLKQEQEQQEQQEQEEQEEQQPQEDEAGEEQDSDEEQQEQTGQEPPQEEQPEEEEARQPEPGQDEEKASQEQQESAGTEGEQQEDEPAEEKAAQAILDAAREEELGPEDVRRQVGVAPMGAPLQDW